MTRTPDVARPDDIVELPQVAEQFGLAFRTVNDRRWRKRAGLRVVRLGGKILGARRSDLEAALRQDY